MTVIGITGPTGAGKTTALHTLKHLGVQVLDCDAVYHRLLITDTDLRRELRERFGDVFDEHGLDRRKLGGMVWNDAQALADLNAITHKYVIRELERRIAQAKEQGLPGAAIDAIALIESGTKGLCDTTVAVTAPREQRIRRIMDRESISREYAAARVNAQKSDQWYAQHCEHTLINDGTQEAFEAKCRAFFPTLLTDNEHFSGGENRV